MSFTHLDQVVEYMRECKLQMENVKIPLIVTGENDHVSSILVKVFKVEKGTPGRTWSSSSSTNKVDDKKVGDYVPAGTTRQATKGQAAQLLPMETRWTPAGVNRTFPIIHVSGTGLIASCRSPSLFSTSTIPVPSPSLLPLCDPFLLLFPCLPSFHKDSVTVCFLDIKTAVAGPLSRCSVLSTCMQSAQLVVQNLQKVNFIGILHIEYGSNFRELFSGNPKNAIIEYLDKLYVENERYVEVYVSGGEYADAVRAIIHAWLMGAFPGNEPKNRRCRLYARCWEPNSMWFTPINPAEMCVRCESQLKS